MGTTLSNLKPPRGAKQKKKRVGRGYGSGLGTTAGRGQKGQKARRGIKAGFEGGQMPLQRRLPKTGFKNPFRIEFVGVNVGKLALAFGAGEVVDSDALKSRGFIPRTAERWKLLAGGQIAHALTVKPQGCSKAAEEKIRGAGGSVEIVDPTKRRQAAKA
jgi:large subunit ribosomal protein L15